MPTYPDIFFYNVDPFGVFSTTIGANSTYTGPASATGTAIITDNEPGIQGLTLDDDTAGNETATATVTIGNLTSTGTTVDAERSWTLLDTVTGQTFQIVQFDVENGAASGLYLISEIPLVVGRTYQTLAQNNNPNATAGDPVLNYNDFYAGWNTGEVDGTAGDDLIDSTYVDPDGDVIDGGDGPGPGGNQDIVYAGLGNDTVFAGAQNDTIYGGGGNDSLDGGSGNDVIYGDSDGPIVSPTSEFLDWSAVAADEANLEGGFTRNTGTMNVTMSWVDLGGSSPIGVSVESSETIYLAAGEPFDNNSSMFIDGNGGPNVSTTTISFAAAAGSGMSDEVENVSFRLNDIDAGTFRDIVTINAFDADGNPVAVTITPSGADTVSGNTITAANGGNTPSQAQGSALVEIAGPVSYLTITYRNGGNTQQFLYVSNIHFDTIPAPTDVGDDTLIGGLGADTMFGEAGADTFFVAQGDVAQGGDGDDRFNLVDLAEPGASTITITGGEGDETAGDTLNFGDLINSLGDITFTNTNDAAGGLSGFVTLADGTIVNFSEIETLRICYASGTLIDTPDGQRPVEGLQPGDLVTTRDRGPQPILWVSSREVPLEKAEPDARPVLIKAGALGSNLPNRDLIVSPQHRILVGEGGQVHRHFSRPALVPAKSMTSLPGVRHMAGKRRIVWHHFACERHEVVTANGCLSESLLLGPMVLKGLSRREWSELQSIFPPIAGSPTLNGPPARPCPTVREVRGLLAANRTEDAMTAA